MKNRLLPFAILFIITSLICGCGKDVAPQKTTGSITFVITEENTPQPLSGVTIQLFSDDDKSITRSDRTVISGRCTFSDIPVGAYSVNLSKPGYESKEGLALRINSGDDSYIELSLKRITTILTVQPSILDFGDDESTVQKSFSLVNPNYDTLTWAILDTEVPWIVSVCDKDGKKNGIIKYNQEVAMSISIDRDKLASGNNESTIVILSDNGRAELKVKAVGADRRTAVTNMLEITDVDMTTAVFNGEVLSVGSPEYTERGFVYSTSSIASDATSGYTKIAAQMNTSKTYGISVSDLKKGTKYYVRAYGKNPIGLSLSSNEVSFTTITSKTTVTTQAVTNIDIANGKAQFNGTIVDGGDPIYSEKGFCYNFSGEPTINDPKIVVSGKNTGNFSYSVAELKEKQVYFVRAYAVQADKVYYGTTVYFKTEKELMSPVIATNPTTEITARSATLNGNVIEPGNPLYTEKGFCYASYSTPTINSSRIKVSGNNSGPFSAQLNGLDVFTKYYARAYIIQSGEVYYGDVVSFEMKYTSASTYVYDVTELGYSTVTFNGNVVSAGDPSITARGFCYSTNVNSYINNGAEYVSESCNSLGAYSLKVNISGLQENSTYYVRSFVVQAGIYLYSDNYVKFTTSPNFEVLALDELVSPSAEMVGTSVLWSGMIGGGFKSNIQFTSAGFVISEYPDPLIGKSNTITVQYSGTDVLDGTRMIYSNVSGIKNKVTYYVKCYVETSYGIKYSEQVQIMQTVTEPVVQTHSYSNLAQQSGSSLWACQINAVIYNQGMPGALEWGFVYGASTNIQVNDGKSSVISAQMTQQRTESGQTVYLYASALTNLQANRTYYFRAYIRTKLGYTYGGVLSFTTR